MKLLGDFVIVTALQKQISNFLLPRTQFYCDLLHWLTPPELGPTLGEAVPEKNPSH